MEKKRKNATLRFVLWFFEGIIVGFGAILPGVSGGTLCVAFGMYRPIIEVLSNIKEGIKKHFFMLLVFFAGVGVGFVGLSGLTGYLLQKYAAVVTCVFVGFILGTVPELFRDASARGRSKYSYISAGTSFVLMLLVLYFLENMAALKIEPGIMAYAFCGVLWGLSFIGPGLSSSALLLFFGLYQPMLEGISRLDPSVILPLGIAMVICVLLLSRGMNALFARFYSAASFAVLGIVAANIVMIFPDMRGIGWVQILISVLSIILAAAVSFAFTVVCGKLKERLGVDAEDAKKEENE